MGNPFLASLLGLQQDGNGAISGPASWLSNPPLLQVETDSLSSIRHLADELGAGDLARWHFLIGGPGNGKSQAVRELAIGLLERGHHIYDRAGTPISALMHGQVPAVLEVRNAAGELVARIAQDASVVTDPFSSDPNPARDLLEILCACEEDGVSIIACANRGVLEHAAALAAAIQNPRVTAAMDELVAVGATKPRISVELGSGNNGRTIRLTAEASDSASLFTQSAGGSSLFERLISAACSEEHWAACSACEHADLCPFLANRNSLTNQRILANLLRILEDAELLDSQPIVFREAAALTSLFLAGSAADYPDGKPCGWVHRNAEQEKWFVLVSRRLHLVLFSSWDPLCLGVLGGEVHVEQLSHLIRRAERDPDRLLGDVPSTQVGVSRLLGMQGAVAMLDPARQIVGKEISSAGWDLEYAEGDYTVELERACNREWRELDVAFEEEWPEAGEAMSALARWKSAHGVRAGALSTGTYPWKLELDAFREAISIPAPPGLAKQRKLKQMVAAVLDSKGGLVKISSNLSLKSEGLAGVEIDFKASAASRAICIYLQGSQSSSSAKIGANAFVWLFRRTTFGLHPETFPSSWLDAAREAISRAASASCYSRKEEGQLQIRLPDNRIMEMMWGGDQVEGIIAESGSDPR